MIYANNCIVCANNVIKWPGKIAPFIADYVFDGRLTDYHLCYCPRCQMIFSDVRFNEDEVKRLYSNYRGADYCRVREAHEPGYQKINDKIGNDPHGNMVRKRFIEHILSKGNAAKINSVLDFGGDRGQFIPDTLASSDRNVYDISGVPPIDGVRSVGKPEEAAPYDLVMCCGVLEHVSFPADLLGSLKRLMKLGGLLYVEVPAGIPTRRYFDVTVARPWLDRRWRPRMHEHINYFTKASLRNTLLLHGFVPVVAEIAMVDLGWSLSPTLGCLARSAGKANTVKYGSPAMFLEGIEYGIRRNLLPRFGEAG